MMIYFPGMMGDELYELLDYDQRGDRVWLEGDQQRQWGWDCYLRPLINGQWAYELQQQRGEYCTWGRPLRGQFADRLTALMFGVKELRWQHRRQQMWLDQLAEKAKE